MILQGKNILITGASSGIGFELAKQLADKGCSLALLNRRTEITDKLACELSTGKNKIISLKCDVSCRDEVTGAVAKAKEILGEINIAILNSGISKRFPVEEFNSEFISQTFDVNVIGMSYCIEALLPDFIKQKNGMIVGVSSLADGRGFPKSGSYCASKAAVTLLLESLRTELKKHNIKVITVKPGFVKTPMNDKNDFQMPFLMHVDKAAKIILKGIEKEKRSIQFPTPTVFAARLLKIIPDFIFDKIAERTSTSFR